MRKTSALLVATALAYAPVGISSPPLARAGDGTPVPAKAKELAQRGRAYHDAGDYPSAIAAFTQAYVIAPSPALLFNLAQAYRLQGNCDDAALMYQRYLATNPSSEARALAESHLASVERCMHKIALHIPVQQAASTSIVTTRPSASLAVDARGASHKAELKKDIGVGLTIAGTAALAAAAVFAVRAHNASEDVSNAEAPPPPGKGGKEPGAPSVGDLDDRGESSARNARILAIGGGIGVATGVVLYVLGKRDERSPVVVAPTTRGAAVSMRWQF